VAVFPIAEFAAVGRAAEGHEQVPVWAPDDGRERAVEILVLVDSDVFDFLDAGITGSGGGRDL